MILAFLSQYRAIFLAVAVALVSGVCWYNGYSIGKSRSAEKITAIYKAGAEMREKFDAASKKALEKYRDEIATLSARPPVVVRCSKARPVPEAASGTSGAGATELDNHDYGPDLRAARDALIRCNALIEIVK